MDLCQSFPSDVKYTRTVAEIGNGKLRSENGKLRPETDKHSGKIAKQENQAGGQPRCTASAFLV